MQLSQRLLLVFAVTLVPFAFYVDVSNPPRSVQGVLGYFAAVFLALWITWRPALWILLGASITSLTIGYFYLSAQFDTTTQFAANRAFIASFLILLGIAVSRARVYQQALARANESLEEKVREQTREITMQRERFHELARAASDCFWRVDRTGENFEVSENSIAALGFEGLESSSPLEKLLQTLDEEARGRIRLAIEERRDFTALAKVDTAAAEVFLEVMGRPIYVDGAFDGYQGVIRNVTQRVLMETALRHAEAMRSAGQLASGLAHDFNNVLFLINANLDLAAAGVAGDAAALIRRAREASDRGAELTGLLMASGRSSLQRPARHDVSPIVQETCEAFAATLDHQFKIIVDIDNDLPRPPIEPAALSSALTNLCLNARDAMPAGGTIRVTTTSDPDGKSVSISVEDSGIGISEEEQKRIFDPFYTSKTDGLGSGLGLAMVNKYMEQIGGAVHVRSKTGEGTNINLSIPV